MPNLSLRGLDDLTLARIKQLARRRKVSVNSLIVESLRQQYGKGGAEFDDLDALAGAWTKAQVREFEAAIAPLGEVDPALWAAEPAGSYGAAPARRKAPRR